MTFLKGFRTIIFSVATILVGIAEYLEIINLIAPEYAPLALLLVGIGTLILRFVTDTPVFSQPDDTKTLDD
jgi:tellurite resistance protein TehA-like permease